MAIESLQALYALTNGLILILSIYLFWHSYGLRRTLFLWLGIKAIAALLAFWYVSKWMVLEGDWLLTTPLTVSLFLVIAMYPRSLQVREYIFPWVWCTGMVGTGFLARLDVFEWRWMWFILSGVCMSIIYFKLFALRSLVIRPWYSSLLLFNFFMWLVFPIIWLIGPFAFDLISESNMYMLFTMFDVLAKGGLFLLVVWVMRGEIIRDFKAYKRY